jgi:hypothetical protein
VYLNAVILFVVGLALVRAHNRWSWTWPTVITVTGWMLLLGGLYRMVAPEAPQVKGKRRDVHDVRSHGRCRPVPDFQGVRPGSRSHGQGLIMARLCFAQAG